MRLQNTVMQLRKACSHPLLFDAGITEAELYSGSATAEELVDSSGKMMVLERLLDELFARKHKALLFSQFTTMLDIIEVRESVVVSPVFCSLPIFSERKDMGNRIERVEYLSY